MNCNNCKRAYELGLREPFMLACAHFFCAGCIEQFGRLRKHTRHILCPDCQCSTPYDNHRSAREQLVPHLYLLGLVAARDIGLRSVPLYSTAEEWLGKDWAVGEFPQPVLPKTPGGGHLCRECGLKDAALKCIECDVFFCAECHKLAHASSNVFRAHNTVPVDSLEHHQQVGPTTLRSAAAKLRNKIKQNIQTEKAVGGRLAPLCDNVSSVTAGVKSSFLELHTSLQKRELSLLEELALVAKSRADSLLQTRAALQAGIVGAMATLKEAQAALGDVDTLREKGVGLLENMAAIKEVPDTCRPLEPIRFVVAPDWQELTTVGKIEPQVSGDTPTSDGGASLEALHQGLLRPPSAQRSGGSRQTTPSPIPYSIRNGSLSARSLSPAPRRLDKTAPSSVTPPPRMKGGSGRSTPVAETTAKNEPPVELIKAYISHIVNPGEFYIHKTSDDKQLDHIQSEVNRSASRHQQPVELAALREGGLCMAQFTGDGHWYRAEMEPLSQSDGDENGLPESVSVFFVDFGNSESLSLERVAVLPSDLVAPPPLALRCCLHRLHPLRGGASRVAPPTTWSSRAVQVLKELGEKEVEIMVYLKQDGLMHVDLATPSCRSLCLQLVTQGLARRAKTDATRTEKPGSFPELLLPGNEMEVYTSNVNTPSDFYVQLATSESDVIKLSDSLARDVASGDSAPIPAPSQGMLVVARWEGAWYRGVVTDVSESGVEVFYVDFGNSGRVTECNSISTKQCSLPKQAIHCTMADLEPFDGTTVWSDEAVHKFSGLVADDPAPLLMRVAASGRGKSPRLPVALYDLASNQNVAESMARSKLARSNENRHSTPPETTSPQTGDDVIENPSKRRPTTFPPPRLPPASAQIQCSVIPLANEPNSPACFHVHLLGEAGLATLQTLEAVKKPVKKGEGLPRAGGVALASFQDDGKWHRVEVTDVGANGKCKLYYVDYGNTAEVERSSLVQCPTHLQQLPALALKCELVGVVPMGVAGAWSHQSCAYFTALVAQCVTAVVEELPSDGSGCVKLSMADVSKHLVQYGLAAPSPLLLSAPNSAV